NNWHWYLIEEFCTLFQTFSFLLYLFQVLFFKLKAGDECLCAGTEYSLTLRLVPPPSSFD
ncbi:hypothetical protein, partial [Lactococcus lactis]|uniref:hypothetical protein n=1 Tax=Lactococcus lactis TaxID=1358 RepID=UPI0021A8923E